MTAYYVSTPSFTVVAQVNKAGRVRHTAPLTHKRWMNKSWESIRGSLELRYGAKLHIAELPPTFHTLY